METINNPNTEKLINIIKENPHLPIMPMVDSDIIVDDCCGYWLGEFGRVDVGEYACYNERFYTDRDSFKEDYYDNNCDELCEMFDYNPRIDDDSSLKAKRLDAYLDGVAKGYFKDAIIVYIDVISD